MKKTKEKGITLIALVITIIVMLIVVAVTVVFAMGENGIFLSAKESSFKQEIRKYQEELFQYRASHYEETRENKINIDVSDEGIKEYIPSMNNNYIKNLFIQNNELCYKDTGNKNETKWARELGLYVKSVKIIIKAKVERKWKCKSEW